MLPEPTQPRAARLPDLGWPPIVERVELTRRMEISEAAYWLASRSRRDSAGLVTLLPSGCNLYAWPHQTVEEIIHTHLRLEELGEKIAVAGRWVPARKLELLRMIKMAMVDRATAMARFALSSAEMAEWESLWVGDVIAGKP
jgi:hypothetical protein